MPFAYCTPQIKHLCRQKRREKSEIKGVRRVSFFRFFMFNLIYLIGLTKKPQGRFLLVAVARRDGYLSPPLLLFCLWLGGVRTTMGRRRNPFSSSLQMGKRKEGFLPYTPTSLWVAEERVGSTVDDYPQGSYLNCFPCIANAKKNFHEIHTTLLFPSLLHCSPYPEACLKDQKHPSLSLSFLFLFLIHLFPEK